MKSNYAPEVAATSVKYATEEVDGLKIAYREAGKPGNPKLVLLHGFPSSSHQYRNLIPALADRFHVISPDYPGFGNSDAPDPREFAYTFDQLAEITGKFLRQKGFDRFGLFVQDYGGPVGFRIVTKSPGVLEWLIIQNTNVYEIGFTAAWGGLRDTLWHNRTPENEEAVAGLLAYDTVKAIYLHGAQKPELISPDNWHSDFFTTIQKPNGRQIQLDLFYDYRTNVTLYPKWQSFLKQNQPKTIIFWGQDDIFFTREGGEAYLDALPKAEMHRLESGHFAVEDCLEYIARHLRQFYDQSVM
jgi:pimeloyl-ACP methyl ester carboxylesterase